MTSILILPKEGNSYRALSGDKESTGRTPGQALDALRSQLTEDAGTLVIVQSYEPDRFFDAAQQERLAELMRIREAGILTAEGESELEGLVEAELRGATERTEDMSAAAGREQNETFSASHSLVYEAAEALRKYLADATDEEKELFGMVFFAGLSSAEIAKHLGVSTAAFRKRVERLRAKLERLYRIEHH